METCEVWLFKPASQIADIFWFGNTKGQSGFPGSNSVTLHYIFFCFFDLLFKIKKALINL